MRCKGACTAAWWPGHAPPLAARVSGYDNNMACSVGLSCCIPVSLQLQHAANATAIGFIYRYGWYMLGTSMLLTMNNADGQWECKSTTGLQITSFIGYPAESLLWTRVLNIPIDGQS